MLIVKHPFSQMGVGGRRGIRKTFSAESPVWSLRRASRQSVGPRYSGMSRECSQGGLPLARI